MNGSTTAVDTTIGKPTATGGELRAAGVTIDLGGRRILDDVSIQVSTGEVVGIAGPNGAGKTTLLDVLAGRHLHYVGTVTLDGAPLDRLAHAGRARRGVARTFQHPVVPTDLPVGRALESARKAFRPYRSKLEAEWAASVVGLDVSPNRLCGSLETLDRRKLLLAALLMRRPKVVLLDEPASGLVTSEIAEIDRVIKMLAWELDMMILIVEHRLELLEAVADRVVVLDLGAVIATGAPGEVFDVPAVRQAYF